MATRHSPAPPTRTSGRGARERILTAATELFYRDGINATGVERLSEHASVSKRTLYQHFPTKTAIVEAYLHRLSEEYGHHPRQDLSPRDRLLAIFDKPAVGRLRGCPFHNAAVEAADAMPSIQAIVNEYKRHSIDTLKQLATAAGARRPAALARQLAVLFEGAMALATSLNDETPIADARAAARTLIDAHL